MRTLTHTSSSVVRFLSRGHILLNTHSHLQKGKRIRLKTTSLRTTLTTGHITLRGGSQQHKETEMHTYWQGTMWHWGSYGLWHSAGSCHYMVAYWRTLGSSEKLLHTFRIHNSFDFNLVFTLVFDILGTIIHFLDECTIICIVCLA